MYSKIGISKLSHSQIGKLLNGRGIRVKSGDSHEIHLSAEQVKKLSKAQAKGAASTLVFDPYQRDNHDHLRGSGFKSVLKKGLKHTKRALKKHVVPHVKKFLKEQADEYLPQAQAYAHKQIDNKVREIEQSVENQLQSGDRVQSGEGIGRFFKKVKRVLKPVGKVLQPIAKQVGNQLLQQAIETGTMGLLGGAVKRKRGRPSKKHSGGALFPAGQSF
jgi:hypothetical protein